MVQGIVTRERMEKRKIVSPEEYGFHKVIVPGREDCQVAVMYRLNLAAGQRYELKPGGEEMNGVCIKGAAGLLICICLWVRFIRFTERAWGRERFL